ncbi:MAG: lasso peptide biosynthesis B2 protein [Acidimicrobiales bacterium]
MTELRLRRSSPPVLRAAWWTLRAHSAVRSELRRAERALAVMVRPPPRLPLAATRGVNGTLARRRATCLERALVLQAWLAAHGERHDIVIGVAAPGGDFQAHAWLDGLEPADSAGPYRELTRLPPPDSGPDSAEQRPR